MPQNRKTFLYGRIAAEIVFTALFALGFFGYIAWFPGRWQLLPAVMRFFARTGLIGAALTVVLFLLSSLLFGRFYCAFFCPLGIIQDVMRYAVPRKGHAQRNFRLIRYLICGLSLGFGFFGNALIFRLLDPYTNSCRILSGSAAGIAAAVLLFLLVLWKKRIFCTALCPAGTLLGAAAQKSLFQLRFTDTCRRCMKCESICPSGCIDVRKQSLDNDRCLRCMECIACCPHHGIIWRNGWRSAPIPTDQSRRLFLKEGATLAVGAVAALAVKPLWPDDEGEAILPPGSWNVKNLLRRCTGCTLCVQHCPQHIIKPHLGRVRLDLSANYCLDECKTCLDVCPTGALRPLPLKIKQYTRIARAQFHPDLCLGVTSGEWCDICTEACPRQAITLDNDGRPQLDRAKCIGCGRCRTVCPAPGKGWSMKPVERQGVLYEV